jgi:hypothetical protein
MQGAGSVPKLSGGAMLGIRDIIGANPDPDPTPDPIPFFSDIVDAIKIIF